MIVRERVEPHPAPSNDAAPAAVPRRRTWTPTSAVLTILPVAALTELLLTRTFYRVGVYIDRTGPFRVVYEVLTAVGSFAFNLASVLVVVALGLLAATGLRSRDRRAGFAIAAFLLASALARVAGTEVLGPTARLTFALAVVAIVAPFLRGPADPLQRVVVAIVAGCFLLSVYAGVTADGARLTGSALGGGVGAQLLAEALVVLAGFAALAAWVAADGFRPGAVVIAAPLAASFLVAWSTAGAVTGILVLWSVGLRLYLPIWLYGFALWAFLTAAIGWLPRRAWRSAGLALLLVAGMLLGSTYLESLGLVALLLLTDGVAVGGLPPVPRASGA
jgi:hypothetical protein